MTTFPKKIRINQFGPSPRDVEFIDAATGEKLTAPITRVDIRLAADALPKATLQLEAISFEGDFEARYQTDGLFLVSGEFWEQLGLLADKLENTLHGSKLPGLGAQFHLDQHQAQMREVRDAIVQIVRDESGEDPWETNPMNG